MPIYTLSVTNNPLEVSVHSRAARRASSPSLNTDKSLKNVAPPKSNPHTHLFTGAKDAGIRKKKNKQLKRGQLVRHKKGLERADIVSDRIDLRLEKSLGKLKTIKERKKEWDVLNTQLLVKGAEGEVKTNSMFAALEDEWVDEEGGEGGKTEEGEKGRADEMVVETIPRNTPIVPVVVDAPVVPVAEEVDEVL